MLVRRDIIHIEKWLFVSKCLPFLNSMNVVVGGPPANGLVYDPYKFTFQCLYCLTSNITIFKVIACTISYGH